MKPDDHGPAPLPVSTPDPEPLAPAQATQSPIVQPGDLSPAAWRALRQRPEMPRSVAAEVVERVAGDELERVRREFAEMEVV